MKHMSQTESEKLKVKSKKYRDGFTLLEMVVVISLLGIIVVIATGFLITTLTGSKKVEVSKEVRQNGSYALSAMEGMILSSRSVSCPVGGKKITVIDSNGYSTSFDCDEDGGKIASNSSEKSLNLTGTTVTVSDCNFSCEGGEGLPVKVNIDFRVSQKGSADLRTSEKSSMRFQSGVITKNLD